MGILRHMGNTELEASLANVAIMGISLVIQNTTFANNLICPPDFWHNFCFARRQAWSSAFDVDLLFGDDCHKYFNRRLNVFISPFPSGNYLFLLT